MISNQPMVIQGTKLPPETMKKSRFYGRGRNCQADECVTVLSMYNKGPYCYTHKPFKVPRVRGRKPEGE